ncbi:MAG TPA: class I adenylate-forming enzyme family protein [Terriglobales bacterium]|nr:class I adenylate-forming enzyme family protein [Terriglobales bacterium]
MTFRDQVLDRIRFSGERVFLVDAFTGRELTYAEFHNQATAVAAYLTERGVRRGDRVATVVPNCTELAIVYFACLYCGAAIVPVNPNLGVSEAGYILTNSGPKCTIVTASARRKFEGVLREVILLSTSQDAAAASDEPIIHLDRLTSSSTFVPLSEASDDDLALVVYTSGTTAKPKGLAHHIGRMVRNATVFADAQGLDSGSRFYLTLSMAYMGGIYNLLLLPFLTGASIVVDHVFDARSSLSFWEKVTKFDVNTLWLAPTILSILLKMDRGHLGENYCRSAIKKTFVGFAPLPQKVKVEFEKRYGVGLIENYGLSETLFVTARSQALAEETADVQGYVGEPLPGIRLRVSADNGSVVPSGEEGEIQILTPDVMAGYISESGDLQRVDAGAWFSTGDYGRLHWGNSLSITGRKKDLIIRGGVNVSPAAIEETLLHAAHVSDAAVVSVPHEVYGEDIVAVLKLEPGFDLDSVLDAIMAQCKQTLAAHQQPSRYMAIDEFPRTSNGKIQKIRLRELVWSKLQISAPVPVEGSLSLEKQGSRA